MTNPTPDLPRTVILGVTASDAHAVANQLIAAYLRQHDFTVVNLGVCTPLAEFADALDIYPQAEAILIGSLNGHAHRDLSELPTFREAGRLLRPVILGGNLSVGSDKSPADLERITRLGVDHIVADINDLLGLLDSLYARGMTLRA